MDIGLQPYLIASPITLIIAQRLVRLICTSCKKEYTPDGVLLQKFRYFLDRYRINKFYKGTGCKECDFTGYLGRIADVADTRKVIERQRGLEKDLDTIIKPEDKLFLKDIEERLLNN